MEVERVYEKRGFSGADGGKAQELPGFFTVPDENTTIPAQIHAEETVELPAIQTMSGYIPVSYTHLDVYKRQAPEYRLP